MPGSESKHPTAVANENESGVGRLISLQITRLRLPQSTVSAEWGTLSSTDLASVTEFWLFLEFFGDFNVSVDDNSVECFDSSPVINEFQGRMKNTPWHAWQLWIWQIWRIWREKSTDKSKLKSIRKVGLWKRTRNDKRRLNCHEFITNSKMPVLPSQLK